MAAGRVYHWKHGWIPLDHASLVETSKAPAKTGSVDIRDTGSATLTPRQQAEVTAILNEATDRLPGLKKRPILVDAGKNVEELGGAWAVTDTRPSKNHMITLAKTLWHNADVEQNRLGWKQDHGAIAGEAKSAAEFRKMAILHELGHVIMGRSEENHHGGAEGDQVGPQGPIDWLTVEPVTPAEMGFTDVSGGDPQVLLQPVARWEADSLDRRSAYAVSNPFEWYAEAFLDGYMNGAKASESGKRAFRIAQQEFGHA